MEIKHKFDLLIETKRRYVIRRSPTHPQPKCAECGEPMLKVEQAAGLFDIKQRRIFQIIETGAAHFAETEMGAAMICLPSLAEVLDGERQDNERS